MALQPRRGGGYLTANQATSAPAKGSRGLGGARGFAREKDDFYPTPAALVEPLIERWRLHLLGGVWEPACGARERTEVLWLNPRCVQQLGDGPLFGVGR